MNRHPAITRNCTALLAVAAAIAALIGRHVGRLGSAASPVARGLRNAALALLRPAESALRRLIIIAAQGLEISLVLRPFLKGALGKRASGSARLPAFRLFDRHTRFTPRRFSPPPPRGIPRIRTFWGSAITTSTPSVTVTRKEPTAFVDVARLHLRLAAFERALTDLPGQARRLARWRTRSAASPQKRQPQPLRTGRPPGFRLNPERDVDHVLRECHSMALAALTPNTS